MNERIDQIFNQVLDEACENPLYRFAELVEAAARLDERLKCSEDYLNDCVAAVEAARLEEREACAKLCESMGVHPALNVYNGGPEWYQRQKKCAAAIRGRTE